MIDLSAALDAFATPGGIDVIRREAGHTVGGRYVEPEPVTTLGVEASVQPTSGEDLELLPEGLRSSESISIWTQHPLRTGEQEGHPADRVRHQGKTYEVQHVSDWQGMAGYTHAVAVRCEP